MAALPPRKNPTPTRISKQNLTPLQTLVAMGFPKHRAEKALASTGNRGVQIASDWLLSHVNDSTLDESIPREYILYACPTGPFLQQLEEFWKKSRDNCGWNGAHNYMPHITLVSFFKAPDECSLQLSKGLKQILDMMGTVLDRPIKLEPYISQNFMGFFVAEDDANLLKRLALQYVKEVSNSIISDTYEQLDAIVACFPWCGAVSSGSRCIPRSSRSISLEPHVKSLHLTLAYQFSQSQFPVLKTLVESLDVSSASMWELRLYSRDSRLATKQVQKVIYPHSPHEVDELELRFGDYIYINSEDVDHSNDGWVEGISWLTGSTGHLPVNYTERTSESDAWTLHKVLQLTKSITPSIISADETDVICGRSLSMDKDENLRDLQQICNQRDRVDNYSLILKENSIDYLHKTHNDPDSIQRSNSSYKRCHPNPSIEITDNINSPVKIDAMVQLITSKAYNGDETLSMLSENSLRNPEKVSKKKNRKIFIMRHGERVDFTFGTWIPYCFDEFSNYQRKDLNMPKLLPKRKNTPEGWQNDSPLTNIGLYQAKLTGEALFEANVKIDHVFCSPAYRCIQTCISALEGLQISENHNIKLEPGLFEWMAWYPEGVPSWLDKDEIEDAQFNVDCEYQPIMSTNSLNDCIKESSEEFYFRNFSILKQIIEKTNGNIFIVAHATTLDTCTRQLIGETPRATNELRQVIHKIPYCSLATVEENDGIWKLVDPDCLPITHSKNPRFEWNSLATA